MAKCKTGDMVVVSDYRSNGRIEYTVRKITRAVYDEGVREWLYGYGCGIHDHFYEADIVYKIPEASKLHAAISANGFRHDPDTIYREGK